MSGDRVVPGPGDPDGTSNVNVSLFFDKPYSPERVLKAFVRLRSARTES